jgi:hypothetical protein
LFEGSYVKDFHEGDTGDAEKVGRVGSQEAGLDNADDLKDKGCGCPPNPDVETGIKKVILVFQKLEFEVGIAGTFFDLADSAKADAIDGDLQTEKDCEGN